ncbi:hypothetical protein D3C84_594900 [compost metagenome]
MIDMIEKSFDVHVYHVVQVHDIDQMLHPRHRMMRRPQWSEAVTMLVEIRLCYWLQHLPHALLHDSVDDAWNSERPCFTIRFRDINAPYLLRSVIQQDALDVAYQLFFRASLYVSYRLAVCSDRSRAFIRFDGAVRQQYIRSGCHDVVELGEAFSLARFRMQIGKSLGHVVVIPISQCLHGGIPPLFREDVPTFLPDRCNSHVGKLTST